MPFTRSDFFDVFARYNEAVWPAQVLVYALAIVAVLLAYRRTAPASRAAYIALAVLWLWMSVVYHAGFFAKVNPAAYGFAALFVAQAIALLWLGLRPRTPMVIPQNDMAGRAGAALIVTGLAVYPLLSIAAGHVYPQQPTFGLPCPTTIFTIGMLLWIDGSAPKRVMVIPAVWTLIASFGALKLGVPEDLTLVIALGVAMLVRVESGNRRMAHA